MSDYTLIRIDQLPSGDVTLSSPIMFGEGEFILTDTVANLLGLLPASNPNVRPRLQDLDITVLEEDLDTFLNTVDVTIANGEVVFLRFGIIRSNGFAGRDTYAIPLSAGAYTPLGSTIPFEELILINQETYAVGGDANTIIYTFANLAALNASDPAIDFSDDTKEYIVILNNIPYLFIGVNGFYGVDELTMVTGDLQALSTAYNLDVSELGDAPVNNINSIIFDGATVTDEGGGVVKVGISGGGGSTWIVISVNKTAVNDEQYSNVANATYTDPSPVEGKGYVVKVVNGTATIGGIGYTEGKIVTRTYHSGSWRSKSYVDETIIGSATQTALDSINFDIESVLENEILESGLVYQVPNIDGNYGTGTGSQYLRLNNAPTTQNALTGANTFGLSCGVLSTTASAGGIAFIRRNDALNLALYDNVETVRDFTVDSAITSGCRYFTGWSKNFQFSSPTNIEPDLQTECILVAKLSTSNNLQILHNDNAGTCTAIALGANFPANSNLYKYRVILQRISSSNYNIQVIRKTLSNGSLLLSSVYNLTTNIPTSGGVFQSIHFITNNADAVDMRLGDYGLIVKKISL